MKKTNAGLDRTPVCGCGAASVAAAARGQVAGTSENPKKSKKIGKNEKLEIESVLTKWYQFIKSNFLVLGCVSRDIVKGWINF